jgi:hypothetical protein
MNQQHVKESFVARIWLEHGDNGDTRWRGHIRHVQGDEESYFQSLVEMRDFLGQVSGVAGLPLTSSGEKDLPDSENGKVTNITRKD